MTETRGTASRGRVLDLVDRFFPLVWIGFYALLPVTGSGAEALETSFDHVRDLEALRSVLENGSATAVDENLIGPGYIATAALIHWVSGLSPENSLIALTRVSYPLAVAGSLVLVRSLVRRYISGSSSVSLPAQLTFVALVFVAGTWHWSDVPWSQFYAAFLAVAFYVLRLVPPRHALVASALTGLVLAMLALARSFEFMAVVAGWGLVAGLFGILGLRDSRAWRPAGLAVGGAAFVATFAAVYGITGKHNSFLLYGSDSGERYGDLLPAEVAEIPTFDLALVPIKVAQIFLDPCFYSLCELHEYAGIREAWRQPLAVQLPALVLLPLCVVALAVLVFKAARRRKRAWESARELRFLVELTVVASGLTLGYVASSWSGSTALRFGFARDFLLPFLLTGVVAVTLGFAALDRFVTRREPAPDARLPRGASYWSVAVVSAVALVAGTVVARVYGLPRLDSRHFETLEYQASCGGGRCAVEIVAANPRGDEFSVPGASLLTFGCGGDEARFSMRVQDPSGGFDVPSTCSEPQLVAAWPATMGVPPNSAVLRSVDVTNSTAG